jgi:hypothetical protein
MAAQTGGTIIQLSTGVSPFSPDSQDGYDEWGSITINGTKYVCPTDGYFVLNGAARSYRWDVQNGMMLQGAQEFLRGVTPKEFTLDHYFWSQDQYQAFLAVISGLQYNLKAIANSGVTAVGQLIVRAIQVFHPSLDLIGISQVNVVEVEAPKQTSDDHMWKATYHLQEYFPPIKLPPQDQDTAPKPPVDPIDDALKDLSSQKEQLANTATDIAKRAKEGLL